MKDWFKNFAGLHISHGFSLAGLAAAAVILTAGVLFLGLQVSGLKQQTAEIESEIARIAEQQKQFVELQSALSGIAEERPRLQTLVPPRKEVLNNIQLLEFLAAVSGNEQQIKIIEAATSKTAKNSAKEAKLPANFNKADFEIDLMGGFVDLMEYLKNFENQPFLSTVKSLSLQAESTRSGIQTFNTGEIRTKIEGSFYFLKE